ncbi:Sigma factor binding protein 1 chloroplastic [Euphorbia peplus]|nr:Sigma factor binding protein 1 chloroplastic [Euphorbia peplus]
MDHFLGVKAKKQSKKSSTKKGIKVVYISSPMKVETSASKFRALVQELTGKDSDSARFMDDRSVPVNVLDHQQHHLSVLEEELAVPNNSSTTTTTSNNSNYSYESSSSAGSESMFDSFDKYLPSMDGSFMSMFQPNFLYDSSDQLDFLQLEN